MENKTKTNPQASAPKAFQVLRLKLRNPITGEEKEVDFLGPSFFTPEEFKKLESQPGNIGGIIRDIKLFAPEDPLEYNSDPHIKNMLDGFEELNKQLAEWK